MTVTMNEVLSHIDREEPDYRAAARMGPAALPHLRELVQGSDPSRAVKAASLAGLIEHEDASDVLRVAAADERPAVRVAAAAASRHVREPRAIEELASLLKDEDAGVRKVAARAMHDR